METLLKDILQKGNTIAAQAILYINQLFEIEQKFTMLSPEGRKEQCLIQEKAILDVF